MQRKKERHLEVMKERKETRERRNAMNKKGKIMRETKKQYN